MNITNLPEPETPAQAAQTAAQLSKKPNFFKRFLNFTERHRLATFLIAAAVIIFGGSAAAFMLAYNDDSNPFANFISPKKDAKFYAALSGVEVTEDKVNAPVRAVMIENSPSARPQSGLKQAEVVYEAVAEGGITRYLILYQQNNPGLIGPVRSVRQYYVDWYAPYDACIAHVGGSAAALKVVRNGTYCDLDQFFNSDTYWRASDRYAPHNVYTNSKKLAALVKEKGKTKSDFTGFTRQDDPKESEMPETNATNITMNFSSASYNTSYTYNAKENNYTRSLGGSVHKDREEGTITPKVVIAMKTQMTAVSEDGYRESIQTTGSGEAIIFQNGTATKATWKKDSRDGELTFVDSEGKAVALNRGQTWIGAVPMNRGGSVSWQ